MQSAQQLISPGQDFLPAMSFEELQRSQELDPTISRAILFVKRKIRPSRRERDGFNSQSLAHIKQWEKLRVQDGVLYRVTNDPLSKQKTHQYVLPKSMKDKALSGVHDLAGHQGQARTLNLATFILAQDGALCEGV